MRSVATTPIAELLAARWSPRAIDPDKEVDVTVLRSLFEAARWAPSCFNEQPWRYVVCNKNDDHAAWQRSLECLVEFNQDWASRAPILIVAAAHPRFSENGKDNRWAEYDTGAASENICLQACSMGLAIHQMGGFDADRLQRVLAMPADIRPIAVIALGYPGDVSALSSKQQQQELAPRGRLSIDEFVSANGWSKPFH